MTFSLEAVKRLQELTESHLATGQQNPRLRASTVSSCADPMLPQEFLPLCKLRGASASLARLGKTIYEQCWKCKYQVTKTEARVIQQFS